MTSVDGFQAELAAFRDEVAQRCARLKDSDHLKGLFLNTYLKQWELAGGAELKARCLAALGEETVHDLWPYPYSGMLRMGLVAMEALGEAQGGVRPFLRAMGRSATEGYLKSPLGRAFLAMLPSTPRAILKLMPWAIRSTFNFGERSVTFEGATAATFRCRFDYSPAEANAGAVEAALIMRGARAVSVEVETFDLFNFDLRLRWAE